MHGMMEPLLDTDVLSQPRLHKGAYGIRVSPRTPVWAGLQGFSFSLLKDSSLLSWWVVLSISGGFWSGGVSLNLRACSANAYTWGFDTFSWRPFSFILSWLSPFSPNLLGNLRTSGMSTAGLLPGVLHFPSELPPPVAHLALVPCTLCLWETVQQRLLMSRRPKFPRFHPLLRDIPSLLPANL